MLAELGDDRARFAAARALKTYAGAAPISCASGKNLVVHHRKLKNQRLAATGYVRPVAVLRAPGAQGALRPATCRRRPALQCATQHLQPDAQLPVPLPAESKTYDELTAFLLVRRCDSTKRPERRPTPLPAAKGRSGTRTPYQRPRHHHEHGGATHQHHRGRR
ncbi:hypothetical protein AB0K16_44120 [Nonomuraea jabiensis]|uniref:hypothetical protein n=1 Tax=Nonomuraea jabiensis TaxID=882448 RepID=UPI003427DF5A